MRVLYYCGDKQWSGSTRAIVRGARGLAARGHHVTIAACGGSRLEREARGESIDTVPINAASSAAGGAWDLRRVIKDRFVEVVIVSSERDQLVVSSARLFADRGAVLRRIPCFEETELQGGGRLALRIAASGAIVTTDREARSLKTAGWSIPTAVVPLGVDASTFDRVEPMARGDLAAPVQGLLIACAYDESGRYRVASVFRALSLLGPRHPNMHVIVFGPGSADEGLRLHASALGVGSFVTFLGEVEDERTVMRAADAGWVVSGADSAAYACLDFMALRIPVIAERTALTQHFVADGITGTLLAPGDAPYTASSVAAFLSSADRLAAMGNAARTRVHRDFTETGMIDALEHAVNAAGDRAQWTKKR